GQRKLLPPDAAGLQSDQLLQAPMSAAAVSKRHSPDPTSEDFVDARTTRPHRKSLAARSPCQRSPRSCLAPRTAQHRAPQGLKWLFSRRIQDEINSDPGSGSLLEREIDHFFSVATTCAPSARSRFRGCPVLEKQAAGKNS